MFIGLALNIWLNPRLYEGSTPGEDNILREDGTPLEREDGTNFKEELST
jgi:hypothetical protein